MSDVEENNFEGRVSTKPREPSSAAARRSGFHGDERGRAGLRGVVRGPAGSSLRSHRDCFLPSQDGFWVPVLSRPPRAATPVWGLTATWTPGPGPLCGPALLPVRSAPRRPHLCGEERVPRRGGAGGGGRTVVGCCWSAEALVATPSLAAGLGVGRARGLPTGRGEAGVGLAGACVSLALYCSERPRLCWNRRRCAYKGDKP